MSPAPLRTAVLCLALPLACSARGGGGGYFADDAARSDDTPSLDASVTDNGARPEVMAAPDRPVATDLPPAADAPPMDVVAPPRDAAAPDADATAVDVAGGRCASWQINPSGVDLALPSGFPAESFRDLGRHSSACAGRAGLPVFTPLDLDADGRLDLLVTSRCGDPPSPSRWQAYLGTPTGFASSPTSLALPSGFAAGTFVDSSSGPQCTLAPPRQGYLLFDYTADGRPDLLMYATCGDASVGTSRWRLFAGTDAGFASETDLALPPGYGAGAFAALFTSSACPGSSRAQTVGATMDLDGDRLPDLVVFSLCDDPAVGNAHWRVYRNNRAGFAPTAARWALPAGYAPDAFSTAVHAPLRCPTTPEVHTITDMDGDRRPDLVVYKTCDDAAVGQTFWRVHRNTGSGFAQEPARWALPSGYAPGAFDLFGDGTACSTRQGVTAGMVDIDGDGRVDLLVTTDCADASVGVTHWKVHLNTGSGFADEPLRVALPPGYAGGDFRYVIASSVRCSPLSLPYAYALGDYDGDRAPDLNFVGSCTDARLGTSIWRTHRGTCR